MSTIFVNIVNIFSRQTQTDMISVSIRVKRNKKSEAINLAFPYNIVNMPT